MGLVTNRTSSRLAQLLSCGVEGWVVDLLAELDGQRTAPGHPTVSPMFSRIADTCERDNGDREEMRVFKAALKRLESEQPDEHAAVSTLLQGRDHSCGEKHQAGVSGLQRVGQWVDEIMEA